MRGAGVSCWDDVFSAQEWGRWPDIDAVSAIAGTAKARKCSLSVLEIGCGPGAQLWYLGHEGHRAVGLDLSSIALDQARVRLGEEQTSASLVRGDAVTLPFSDGRFDVVLDVEAFAHCPSESLAKMWDEVARVLVREGIFVSIAFSNGSSEKTGFLGADPVTQLETSDHPLSGKGNVVYVDEESVRKLARGAGFQHVTVDRRTRTFSGGASTIEELVTVAGRISHL
jgi:ubiquinone/menaquinone biosynthesis C-methylase UbiE